MEGHRTRLPLERRAPARMAVAEARDRVAAVKVEELAAVARMQPDAVAVRDLDRVLRVDPGQMAAQRLCNRIRRHQHAPACLAAAIASVDTTSTPAREP